MKHRTFSIRVPEELCEPLETEASEEFRTRNQMIVKILRDRYHSHAPPKIANAHTRSAQAMTARTGRKTNSTN